MSKVYQVFDKYCVIDIIFGFLLGFYLAIYHNDSHLWFLAIQIVIIFSIIMTLIPVIVSIYDKYKYSKKISIRALIEAFILNLAMTVVPLIFGFVIGSFVVENYIADNGKLFK